MRVLITGGGTAGHVNPALAIADAILARESDAVIEYVGTQKGIEGRLVTRRGMTLHPIEVYGLRRSLSPYNIKALAKAISAKKRCKSIIRDFKPDVIVGTGGYASFPALLAASKLGIPTCVHEANAMPGLTTRMAAAWAARVLICFEESACR